MALTAAATLLLAGIPQAEAGPEPALCEPDRTRGAVPEDFALDSCIDATAVTVRNSLDFPVVVLPTGDLAAGVPARTDAGPVADLTRRVAGEDDVLLPGDTVRWPLGPGPGALTVTRVEPSTAAAVVDALGDFLPRRGDPDVPVGAGDAFAAVAREIAAAIEERTSCLPGKNFLRVAACDVDTASWIGGAISGQLARGTAVHVAPLALDRDRWAVWYRDGERAAEALARHGTTLTVAAARQ